MAVLVFCTGIVFQLYIKGALPPTIVAVAIPSFSPKQLTFFMFDILTVGELANAIVILMFSEHKWLSVTVTI